MSDEFTISPTPENDLKTAQTIVPQGVNLVETNVSERKAQSRERRSDTKKILAKTAVSGIDNLDSIFGVLQGVSLVLFTEFARRGELLNVGVFVLAYLIFYMLKIRMPAGSFTKIAKSSGDQIKSRLIDLSTTFIR